MVIRYTLVQVWFEDVKLVLNDQKGTIRFAL